MVLPVSISFPVGRVCLTLRSHRTYLIFGPIHERFLRRTTPRTLLRETAFDVSHFATFGASPHEFCLSKRVSRTGVFNTETRCAVTCRYEYTRCTETTDSSDGITGFGIQRLSHG